MAPARLFMSRKTDGSTATNSTTGSSRSLAALKGLRSQVDKLDVQIVKLINERASRAAQIVRQKTEQGEPVFSPSREDEVLQNVMQANEKVKGPLPTECIRSIFREIMSGSRALEKILKVAYLGPEYSFSHLAALERFGQSVELVPVASIAAVFEEVDREHIDFGVVPVENSTDGRVADTLEMFLKMQHLTISSEVRLNVHHNLVANCEPQEIRRVYSKPQALSQCRNWLSKNVPQALLKDVSSTATAAELAQREPGAAAVASRQAAVRYGLRILFENIEDSPHNETRFAVIGQQHAARTGNDKTALVFRVSHSPGALVEALEIFRQNKINLTWIESFPSNKVGGKPEYIFFVDFEGHVEDAKVTRALKALGDHCLEINVLGSFPVAMLVG
jgi:chorismate mutase/prephenate dehydratase